MTLRSSQGSSRYASGEQDVFIANFAGIAGGVRGALYLHGVAGTAADCRDYSRIGELHLVNAIAELFPVLSIDAGGTAPWGNATARARVGDGKTRLQGTPITPNGPYGAKSGKIVIIGSSMGAQTAMAYANANPTLVAGVVGVIPVCDLNDIVVNNRNGMAAGVNAAYGGTYNDATDGLISNPTKFAAGYSIPTLLYYASDDPVAIPSATTAFAAAATNVTAVSVGALGHTQAAMDAANRTDILTFLAQFA